MDDSNLPEKSNNFVSPSPLHEGTFVGSSVGKGKLTEMFKRGVLGSDETLDAAIWGSIESPRGILVGKRSKHDKISVSTKVLGLDKRSGLLGLTNRRIIFYMPKMMNRYEFEAYVTKQIDSIQFTKGLRKCRIDIHVGDHNRIVKGIDNEEGMIVVDMIQKAIDDANTQSSVPTVITATPSAIDVLKMKFVNGEITKEEFKQKKEVLDNL